MSLHILDSILNGFAHLLHPDRPRSILPNVEFPTDIPVEEVMARLNEAAAGTQLAGWYERRSITDLMKLTHPDNPDEASSKPNRTILAKDLGRDDYTGTAEDNEWLFWQVIKAAQQRGLALPTSTS